MAHIPDEQWKRYVMGQLDDDEREKCENHLYQCDRCIENYLAALELCQKELPDPKGELFSDEMYATVKQTFSQTSVNSMLHVKRTVYHYLIAAGLTIILLYSGVFQSITDYVGEVHETALSEDRTSLTDRVLERAFSVWQPFDQKSDGGERNE